MPQSPASAGERRSAPRVAHLPPATRRIIALKPHSCRWPIGETGAESFIFCSASRLPLSSYCSGHTALARGKRR